MTTAARVWTSLVYIALDVWVALLVLIPLTVGLALAAGLAVTVVGGAASLAATLASLRWLGGVDRARAEALLGMPRSPPKPRVRRPHRFGVIGRVLSDRAAWKALAYWSTKLVSAPVGFSLVLGAWCGALALLTLPLYVGALPDRTARFGIADVHTGGQQAAAFALGVALALVSPPLTLAFGQLNASLTASLLGPSRVQELEQRLGDASARRDAAVEAAEAERRRIERDLHDGAQQRLVALGMSLGMAKEKFETDPDAARALLEEAHGEAKAAMSELRNIARGIHPAVLSDRGLDAALSGLVARAPIPVELSVSIGPQRLEAAVEGAAYYVVAEALTNVAKHASARRADVRLAQQGGRLIIEVSDNGVGGAAVRSGGGLAGLSERVRSLGGELHVLSPPGGPTTLLVELPCAS